MSAPVHIPDSTRRLQHFVHNTVIATYRAPRRSQLEIGCNRFKLGASRALYSRRGAAWSPGGIYMTTVVLTRRNLLGAGGAVLTTGVSGLLLPARAEGLAPTDSMWGGSNNYRKGAAIV